MLVGLWCAVTPATGLRCGGHPQRKVAAARRLGRGGVLGQRQRRAGAHRLLAPLRHAGDGARHPQRVRSLVQTSIDSRAPAWFPLLPRRPSPLPHPRCPSPLPRRPVANLSLLLPLGAASVSSQSPAPARVQAANLLTASSLPPSLSLSRARVFSLSFPALCAPPCAPGLLSVGRSPSKC